MHRIPTKLNILNLFAFEQYWFIYWNSTLHSPLLDYMHLDNLFEIYSIRYKSVGNHSAVRYSFSLIQLCDMFWMWKILWKLFLSKEITWQQSGCHRHFLASTWIWCVDIVLCVWASAMSSFTLQPKVFMRFFYFFFLF